MNLDPRKTSLATVYQISSQSHFACHFMSFSQKPCAAGSFCFKDEEASRPLSTTVQQGPARCVLDQSPTFLAHAGVSGAPPGLRASLLTFPAPPPCCAFMTPLPPRHLQATGLSATPVSLLLHLGLSRRYLLILTCSEAPKWGSHPFCEGLDSEYLRLCQPD